jgi:hypothetical protein
VNVINYSNRDGVNNNPVGVSGAAGNRSVELFAVPAPTTGPSAASKLLVGPRQFLSAAPAAAVAQRLGAPNGNYRVVAAGACCANGCVTVITCHSSSYAACVTVWRVNPVVAAQPCTCR